MASRWMAPKLAKMKRDTMKAPHEITKTRAGRTPAAAEAVRSELNALVAQFKGTVVKCEVGRYDQPIGKGKRRFNAAARVNGGWSVLGSV